MFRSYKTQFWVKVFIISGFTSGTRNLVEYVPAYTSNQVSRFPIICLRLHLLSHDFLLFTFKFLKANIRF